VVIKLDVLQSDHDIIGNSKPFEMNNVPKEQCAGTTSVNRVMLAEIPLKTVAQITNALGCLLKLLSQL
jgi:hypothetical protein